MHYDVWYSIFAFLLTLIRNNNKEIHIIYFIMHTKELQIHLYSIIYKAVLLLRCWNTRYKTHYLFLSIQTDITSTRL